MLSFLLLNVKLQQCKRLILWDSITGQFGYTHKEPERVKTVYKLSLRTQDSAVQKPDQNRNASHSLYNRPYALNRIQLSK